MTQNYNEFGRVSIANDVYTSLAGAATISCFGVRGMAMRGVSDGLVHLLKREVMGKGVHIEFNEDGSISIEIHIIVKTGVNIPVICSSIIREVAYKVHLDTDAEIRSVDVFVDSIMPD